MEVALSALWRGEVGKEITAAVLWFLYSWAAEAARGRRSTG